ncbi:hypothetical protein FB567DRAFT_631354 [Paraphoma chrysanthemicola]|uniref:Thymidylate kinase n=1 Tax=Paraphoma chrysanthemicola TaxID=798071 RepID=A0A8K0VUW5_9PLEO|nr:hypothetical protein FB567DRAFT_631354 [Paraphoma chrysanthemicola]
MSTITRQPFGELSDSRLQVLQSAKNRQNAILPSFTSSLKPSSAPSTGKRQRGPDIFEDAADSENMDPSIFASPTKKSKTSSTLDFDFIKPSKFNLVPSPVKSVSLNATPSVLSTRRILTPSSTAKSTPINNSRGSPKNKRIAAISKHRRASSSPFRRVDPPSFSQSSPALPFSIDAALSGTISGYTPKSSVTATPTPVAAPVASTLEDSMPKAWFFEIHEDTPEQEAANLMEHSASVLDISSDDDVATKQRNEELERGKENIPPPDFLAAQPRLAASTSSLEDVEVEVPAKRPRLRKFVQDAMDEDRRPLGDLAPSEFYGEGCDASSYVTVDAGIEKPSSLSKEFDFSCPSPERDVPQENVIPEAEVVLEEVIAAAEVEKTEEPIAVHVDENVAPAAEVVAEVVL